MGGTRIEKIALTRWFAAACARTSRGATIIDDFVSVEVNVEETLLPRTSLERNFKLHLTLGYESDYSAGIARDAVTRINERW